MKTPDQLIDLVAVTESGGRYDAWNPNDNGAGVSCGLIQFNQKRSSLPKLLLRMYNTDEHLFLSLTPMELTDQAYVRRMDLNKPKLKTAILALLRDPIFQQVQRDLARKEYLEPAWKLCQRFGLKSERALAMFFDTAVQRGIGWLTETIEQQPIQTALDLTSERKALEYLAARADKGLGEKNGRRHKLLHSPALSDEPWTGLDTTPPPEPRPVLQFGMRSPAVRELQSKLLALGYRQSVNHSFGPETRDNVKAFQGACGLAVDSVVGPLTWAALDAALAAAGEEGEGKS